MILIGVLMAVSVATSGDASADPLAASNRGELQCYRPDVEKKTCQSIGSYKRTGSQTYLNTALLAVGTDMTLETHSPVIIKADAVCGTIRRQELLAGTLRTGNQVIPSEMAKPLLERVAQVISPFFNKEVCTRYEPTGADFTAKVSIDGAYQPDRDVIVKWIAPTDGYTVAESPQVFRTVISVLTPELEAQWMEAAKRGMETGGYGFSWTDTPYGVSIIAVAPGSRAEVAGLKPGDQVVEVNGKSTMGMSRNEFWALIHSKPTAGFDFKIHGASDVRLPPL